MRVFSLFNSVVGKEKLNTFNFRLLIRQNICLQSFPVRNIFWQVNHLMRFTLGCSNKVGSLLSCDMTQATIVEWFFVVVFGVFSCVVCVSREEIVKTFR